MSKYRLSFSGTTFRNLCFSMSSNCDSESVRNSTTDTDTASVTDINDTKMASDSAFIEAHNEGGLSAGEAKNEGGGPSYNTAEPKALQDSLSTQETDSVVEKCTRDLSPEGVTAARPIRENLVQKPFNREEFVVKANRSSYLKNANDVSSLPLTHGEKSSLGELTNKEVKEAQTDTHCVKISPTELIFKQERVRESLKRQGVVRDLK